MYEGRKIGAIVTVPEDVDSLRVNVRFVPPCVDGIFIAGRIHPPEIAHHFQETFRNTRLEYLSGNGEDNPAEVMHAAYRRALEAGMDVIAVMDGDHDVNPALLPLLVEPVAQGMADYAWIGEVQERPRMEHPYGDQRSSPGPIQYIQHCRMAGGNLRRMDMDSSRNYVVYSRSALRRLYEHPPDAGNPKVLAAIPCLNEEISIGSVVLKTRKYVDEVMVIDDGSGDETARVAEEAGATVIRHRKNRGKAAGVKTALRYALDHPFDLIVLLDGDGQHKPEEIPALARPVLSGEADLVIGSRFLENNNGSVPVYRRLGQTILTLLTNATSTQKTTDSQSGFRALNRKAMESLTIESEGYSIESDMISHLSQKGIRIQETPITAIYDVPNKHKKDPFYHGYDIVANMVGEVGYKRPMLLFGLAGGFLVLVGLIIGSYVFANYSMANMLPFGFTIASSIARILGMLLIVAGLILNSLVLIMNRK